MKFYEIDHALQEAITTADKRVRLRVEIDFSGKGYYEAVFPQDILEADFYGLKEAAGGTSARGEVLLANDGGMYGSTGAKAGSLVKVSFSLGEGLPYFQRFTFYIDNNGIQDIQGPGRKRFARIRLVDGSAQLQKTDETKDWTAPVVFTYVMVCDKTTPERSLVHLIAKRAGITADDIDCTTIPVTLPYVRLTKNLWAELSGMATAYRGHVECAPEKPLVFAHSPYQTETLDDDDVCYTFTGEDIFYLRKSSLAELYRNTIRLKVNLPMALEKQEIWQYDDPPVFYDEYLQAHYPFKYPLVRDIEQGNYEALYRIKDNCSTSLSFGKERRVIYGDEIDTKEEAENRLDYDGGPFSYAAYDTTTHHDRAILTLNKDADGDLYRAAIWGRPIVLDLNRSCFIRDNAAAQERGTAALNVTGHYFSEYLIDGKPHYEDWAGRELAERLLDRREFTVKTHRALFHGRIGAKVAIQTRRETVWGKINAFSLRYRKEEAFVATFKITEEI